MLNHQLEALKRLNIPVKKWGSSYRVKVRGRTSVRSGDMGRIHNRVTYISNLERPQNRALVAKYYKIKLDTLNENLSPKFKRDSKYKFTQGRSVDNHLYEYITEADFYPKLENIMNTQKSAYKINLALGYTLYDEVNGVESYFYPNIANTSVFDKPFTINSKSDIPAVYNAIKDKEKIDAVRFQSSSVKLKEIIAFQVFIYHLNYALGDSDAIIPEVIKKNRHVINFPKTNNKCMFYCIAYHLDTNDKKDPRRIQAPVKNAFKKYCEFKDIKYSLGLYRTFKPINIIQFDDLEECFSLNIDVYEMDLVTSNIQRIRKSSKSFENTINILSHDNHAMYITKIDNFLGKYQCPKCDTVFTEAEKLRNHKRNRCEEAEILSFVKKPTIYQPSENVIKAMLQKYGIKDIDHYTDHFIVYDFEAVLATTDIQHGESTRFTNRHIPTSVSIRDSLSRQVQCFVNENPRSLLEEMFKNIESRSSKIKSYNYQKFSKLISKIESKIDESEDDLKKRFQRDLDSLRKQLDRSPLLGFNSARYDINLIKNDLFDVLGCENIRMCIKNPGYMCIATDTIKMLDISNFVPAGTSYEKYLETYLGCCQCDDKISCTCGLGKGLFPYEYITSYEVLNQRSIPPKSAFDSKFRETSISDDDYERVKFVWKHYGMKSVKDLLVWYNNLDVVPFIDAINAQRELFKRFNLDMFTDGVSLPGLSEKVMYQSCFSNLIHPSKDPGAPFTFSKCRFAGYRTQDKLAGREFSMTIEHVNNVLRKQKYVCALCFCKLTKDTASVDRVNNKKGHVDGNIMIACKECNVARKDMNISAFRRKKLIDFNADRLVWSVDEEQKDVYFMMKQNIAGGPSIIFNRYAKRNETSIRGESGKLVKKVIGYDANALYLWALGNDMPCDRLTKIDTYDGIIDDILNDKIFGFLECDIETPAHLKDYFSEMTPIFKNVEIDPSIRGVIGDHMFEFNLTRGANRAKKARKLIGSYFGTKILIYTPLLKWYLAHGMTVTKTYSFVKASAHKAFKPFMDAVSNARREGDIDKSKSMIAEMMKLVGNSAFGRSGMDMTKHKEVKFESDCSKENSLTNHFAFVHKEELNGAAEITMKKRQIKLHNPIHLSIAIYQLAKLRMLQFYYDCIDFYFDRSDFQYQEMDTDSAYIAFSSENPFNDLIKPELRDHFQNHKYDWFPRDDTKENAAFDRRTPGLFKEEWRGDAIISLSSKNYICYLPDESHKVKISAKGVQQSRGKNSHVLNPECFKDVVSNRVSLSGTNKGFRFCKESKSIITYEQHKTALNYYYDKRKVLEDGISTIPLDI